MAICFITGRLEFCVLRGQYALYIYCHYLAFHPERKSLLKTMDWNSLDRGRHNGG